MPRYSFECGTCELRFERNLRVADDQATHKCPDCNEPAPLVMSNFGFAFAEGKGAIANSGVHDLDYPTADKLVGRDADVKWQNLRAREAVKKKAREQGQTDALIRRQGRDYIDYEPMSDHGVKARRNLVKDASTAVKIRDGK